MSDLFSVEMLFPIIGSFSVALILTALCIPVIIKLSKKYQLVDNPDHRKLHKDPVPTLGGVGFFIGTIIIFLFWMFVYGKFSDAIPFFGLITLFVTGIFDDLKDLRASVKFLIQIIVALVIAYYGFKIDSLNGVFGIYGMPVLAQYAFSVLLIVGLTNAFNLIDGIDGLAGGLAFINSLVLGFVLLLQSNVMYSILAFTFAGALLGFLIFNFNPAKIFMGDTGSLIVGFLMAVLGIVVMKGGAFSGGLHLNSGSLTIIVVGILLLPVYDTLRVFTERILKKNSPFKPDKTHVHHLLIETGANHKKAAIILYISDILIIALAFLIRNINPSLSILLLFILASVLSESINLKRWLIEVSKGKQASEEKIKITSENRFLEDILDDKE